MGEQPDFDLQSHSTCSDGTLAPEVVVAAAAAAGVRLLALTDHDSLDGVRPAIAAGRAHGLRVVAACEITALNHAEEDRHILAYGLDVEDVELCAALACARADRGERADRVLAALTDLGFAVDEASIDDLRLAGRPIGRPHLAAAVVTHPANRARLEAEGCPGLSAFLEAYLIPGRPAYCPRLAPTISEAVDLIHGAGGLAVWAHPFFELHVDQEVCDEFDRYLEFGIDGVEAFYVTHTRAQVHLLHARASAVGLLITGSADFHGPDHVRFSRFRAFDLYGLAPRLGDIDA